MAKRGPKPGPRGPRGPKRPDAWRPPKGVVPPQLSPWKKGDPSPNPGGRCVGGRTYERTAREYLNDMRRLTEEELQTISRNKEEPTLKRKMARNILNLKEEGLTIIDIIEQIDGRATQAGKLDVNITQHVKVIERIKK